LDNELTLLDARLRELSKASERHATLLEEVRRLERGGGRGNSGGQVGQVGQVVGFFAGRRSMARELLESGGLAEGRMGLEILFLLPDEFVEFYSMLFHRALKADAGMGGGSGGGKAGIEKAKGRTGMASEHDLRGRAGTRGPQSSGSGKKYKTLGLIVGSERMLEIKSRMDQELLSLVRDARLRVAKLDAERNGEEPRMPTKAIRCGGCKGFVSRNWRFCSMCGKALTR